MRPDDFYVSMVIDRVEDHAYKADLLIKTLHHYAKIPPARIILHYVNQLDPMVVAPFGHMGCKTRGVEPFLDARHCNKLQQLTAVQELGLHGSAGLLLLDLDIAVAAPFQIADPNRIWGKLVDAPNPPIGVLQKIFQTAGVIPPAIVQSDWNLGETYATNLNGGVLYIPSHLADSFGAAWRDFAAFLFAEKASFEGLGPHIDQISFALALCSTNTPYSYLSANNNFPTHFEHIPRSYNAQQPIQALHYHWELDDFGFVGSQLKLPEVEVALEAVNRCAITTHNIGFYERFKRGRAKAAPRAESAMEQTAVRKFAQWTANTGRRPKITVHAGTSKTGTKSLQFLLDSNRALLAEQGIWYPDAQGHPELKHQFLVDQMLSGDSEGLLRALMSALDAMPDSADKILFSSEGLFNHWRNFSAEELSVLRAMASKFPVEVIVCFRDPVELAVSLYCQNLRNPPIHPCYGSDQSIEEMLEDSWFKWHLDYVGFLFDLQNALGNVQIRIFNYSSNIVSEILQHIGAKLVESESTRRNKSLHRQGVEIVRIVNRYRLEPAIRDQLLAQVVEIEKLFGEKLETFMPSAQTIAKIKDMTHKNTVLLESWADKRVSGSSFSI